MSEPPVDRCLVWEELEEFASGAERPAFRRHLDGCARCADQLAEVRAHAELEQTLREHGEEALVVDAPSVRFQLTEAGFEVQGTLHRGGQGVVYEALQREPRRRVAIKTLLQGALASEGETLRFQREIGIVSELEHPNLVRVHESGVTASGLRFLVMEFLEGPRLDRWVEAETPTLEARLRVFLGCCAGVETAHRAGVVHRDLKPSNVVVEEGTARVLDFGLAVRVEPFRRPGSTLTRTGQFVGSLVWSAPEQVSEEFGPVGPWTDVHGLGNLLRFLVSGEPPLPATADLAGAVRAIVRGDRRPLRGSDPRLRALEGILRRARSRHPRDRYPTVSSLARDVRAVLEGRRPEGIERPAARRFAGTLREHPALGLGVAALLVGLIGLGVLRERRLDRVTRELVRGNVERARLLARFGRAAAAEELLAEASERAPRELRREVDWGLLELRLRHPNVETRDLPGTPPFRIRCGPAGERVLVRTAEGLWLADNSPGAPRLLVDAGGEDVRCPTFSPDGRFASFLIEGRLHRVEIATGGVRRLAADGVVEARWSGPDLWTLGDTGELLRWGPEADAAPTAAHQLGEDTRVSSFAWLDPGRELVLLLSEPSRWEVWNLGEDRPRASGDAFRGLQVRSAPGGDAFLLYNRDVRVWRMEAGRPVFAGQLSTTSGSSVVATFLGGPDLVATTGGAADNLVLWGLGGSPARLAEFSGHRAPLESISASEAGDALLSVDQRGQLKRWDPTLVLDRPDPFEPARGSIHALAFAEEDQRLFSGADDGARTVVERAGERRENLVAWPTVVAGLDVRQAASARLVAAGYDGGVRLLRAGAFREAIAPGRFPSIGDVGFVPGADRYVTVHDDGRIRLFDFASADPVHTLTPAAGARLTSLAVDPAGLFAVAGSRGGELVWFDPVGGVVLFEQTVHTGAIRALDLSRDGRWLVTGGDDRRLFLVDTAERRVVRAFEGHESGVLAVAFCGGGNDLFASAGFSGVLRLWSLEAERELATLPCSDQPIYALAGGMQREVLAAGGEDGRVRVFDFDALRERLLPGP